MSLVASHEGGEACVCDLNDAFDLSQPTISHHMKVLYEVGLVDRDKRGVWVYYRVRPQALATLSRLAELLPPGDSVLAVDAETASRVLEVTPRTARRLLRALAEEGLAWPLPPNRAPQPGRPRQSYRLVVERLDRHRTGDDG